MFQRIYFQALAQRLKEPGRFLQVLASPRQVGKGGTVLTTPDN